MLLYQHEKFIVLVLNLLSSLDIGMRMKTFYHVLLKVGILEGEGVPMFKLYAKLKSVKRILKSS